MDNVVAIITARMESTRLPGKALLPLAGEPSVKWCVDRCRMAEYVDKVVVATYKNKSNTPLWLDNPLGAYVINYPGHSDDVIGRIQYAAWQTRADVIVDITGDCPLVDPRHIDSLILNLKTGFLDYVSNDIIDRSWPDGLDIQVYTRRALEYTIRRWKPKHHTGWNIAQHPEVFRMWHWKAPIKYRYPEWGLTLDTKEDYELLKIIFDKFGDKVDFKVADVIDWLKENPELLELNKSVKRKDPEKEG